MGKSRSGAGSVRHPGRLTNAHVRTAAHSFDRAVDVGWRVEEASDILSLVRGLVSGELVVVEREELWRVGVSFKELLYDDPDYQLALQKTNGWLTPEHREAGPPA